MFTGGLLGGVNNAHYGYMLYRNEEIKKCILYTTEYFICGVPFGVFIGFFSPLLLPISLIVVIARCMDKIGDTNNTNTDV